MKKISEVELKPGDLILTASNGFMSKIIRFFSKLQTGSARFSHAAMYVEQGLIIESLVKVRINKIEKYDGQKCIVWRLKGYDDKTRQLVVNSTLLRAGNEYGWFKIPLFALDAISTKIVNMFRKEDKQVTFFTSKFGFTKLDVCSILFADNWTKTANHNFGIKSKSITPDWLDDYMIKNNQELIFTSLED